MQERNGRFLYPADASRIDLSKGTLTVDGCAVVRKIQGRYKPINLGEISALLDFQERGGADQIAETAKKICRLLEQGKEAEAIFLASMSKWRFKPDNIVDKSTTVCKANFNPFEPRDKQGLWSREEESSSGSRPDIITDVAYQGNYHDELLDEIIADFRSKESSVVKEINITGINGITARADAIVRPKGGDPYILELKTGNCSAL